MTPNESSTPGTDERSEHTLELVIEADETWTAVPETDGGCREEWISVSAESLFDLEEWR